MPYLSNELVTVVIPVRNRRDMLFEAVRSVAEQTYSQIELIVVDDNSDLPPDDVVYSAWGSRSGEDVRILQVSAGNANVGRALGLEQARGEYVQFLDSDDWLHPEKLARQVAHLTNSPDIDASVALEEVQDEDSTHRVLLWNLDIGRNDNQDYSARFLSGDLPWSTNGPLWKTASLRDRKLTWDPTVQVSQDWVFHCEALLNGLKAARLPEILSTIRIHRTERVTTSGTDSLRYNRRLYSIQTVGRVLAPLNDRHLNYTLESHVRRVFIEIQDSNLPRSDASTLLAEFSTLLRDLAGSRKRKALLQYLPYLCRRGLQRRFFRLYTCLATLPTQHPINCCRVTFPLNFRVTRNYSP